MNKKDLLESPIYISEWYSIPWHECNVHMHIMYSPRLRETTLTLFTKDHQKILKLTDEAYTNLGTSHEKNNWCLLRMREWCEELRTLYQNMGD